jgi:hypothetical protein
VPFLDGVVRFEVRDELGTEGEELAEGEVGGAATGLAGVPEGVPGLTEVVVLGRVATLAFAAIFCDKRRGESIKRTK